MTFNDNMRIDPNRVQRSGGSRGGRIAIGGGAGGILVLILALLFGGDPGSLLGTSTDTQQAQVPDDPAACDTTDEINTNVDCRVRATVQSLDSVWGAQFAAQTGVRYAPPEVRLFSGGVSTGCGQASSDVGPFYCPADQTAYFDTSFFQELVSRFGSSGGPLAQEYVVAHEVGHHLQNQLGDLARAQADPQGADSGAVRSELQADCYAGAWAHYADKPGPNGEPAVMNALTETDIRDALSAAAAVGDDHIQSSMTGRVNPEGWTHGSSEQRQKWFYTGYRTGQIAACDTFSARDLDNPDALR